MKKTCLTILISFGSLIHIYSQNPIIVSDTDMLKRGNDTTLNGKPIPSFSFTDINGQVITNDSLADKIVFLSFWFSSCEPCIAEMPMLNKLYDEYSGQVEFIALSFDDEELIMKTARKNKFKLTLISTTRDIIEQTGLVRLGYPTNILIKDNVIFFKYSGGYVKSPKFDQKINESYLMYKNEIEKLIAF